MEYLQFWLVNIIICAVLESKYYTAQIVGKDVQGTRENIEYNN